MWTGLFTMLIPDAVFVVCPDSPVSVGEVSFSLHDVWQYPEDLATVSETPGTDAQCATGPEPGFVLVKLWTPESKAGMGFGEETLAVTVQGMFLINKDSALAVSGTLWLPADVDPRMLTHEIGHAIGRKHSTNRANIMWPYSTPGPYFVERWTRDDKDVWEGAARG